MAQYHEQVQNLKNQESTLRRGLNIFKIEQAPSKDLHTLEKDLEHLEQVWTITKEWEELWDSWKVGRFAELVTTDMEHTSQMLFKRLNKTIREVKDKNWDICDSIKGRIEQFKRTMPLIQDLKNPAMRDRHWSQIKSEVQKPFDHTGKTASKMLLAL